MPQNRDFAFFFFFLTKVKSASSPFAQSFSHACKGSTAKRQILPHDDALGSPEGGYVVFSM